MSTNGSTVCNDGLVNDNFLLYTTIPCSLRLNVHVGLSILWVILSGLLLFELVLSRLLGHFSKFHAAKKITASVLARDSAYLCMVIGCFILFIIVICDPQASVQDRVGTGLWIAVGLTLSGLLGLPTAFTVFNIQPLLTTVGINSSTFKQADFNGKVFLALKVVQNVVVAIFSTISIVTIFILTNTLVNFHDRQVAVDACFISFGIASAISLTSFAVTNEAIIKVIDARIQFEQDLPAANNHDAPTPLSIARTRLRVLTIVIPIFGLFFCVMYILIGANVIPLNWIVAHVIFGFLPASGLLAYRLIVRDSLLEAHCCLVYSTSPHHSSKDRDVSDQGSGGKVTAIDKARASVDYSSEPSSPSEILARLDLSSFKTPAHALLAMPEESEPTR